MDEQIAAVDASIQAILERKRSSEYSADMRSNDWRKAQKRSLRQGHGYWRRVPPSHLPLNGVSAPQRRTLPHSTSSSYVEGRTSLEILFHKWQIMSKPYDGFVDYYVVLGISQATLAEINRAYRAAAMKCHPDHGGSHEKMKLINEAWIVLSDPDRRREYDEIRTQKADTRTRADWGSKAEDVGRGGRIPATMG